MSPSHPYEANYPWIKLNPDSSHILSKNNSMNSREQDNRIQKAYRWWKIECLSRFAVSTGIGLVDLPIWDVISKYQTSSKRYRFRFRFPFYFFSFFFLKRYILTYRHSAHWYLILVWAIISTVLKLKIASLESGYGQ